MTVYKIDPLQDPRWVMFLKRHPRASVFHTPGWLEALRRTYGYKPVVFTTSYPGEELRDGLVFCRVMSWLTGCRMVSVAFSDHCQPLVDSRENLKPLVCSVLGALDRENWKYIELRPLVPLDPDLEGETGLARSESFYFHKLDLRPDLDTLFQNFHKNCVRRKIQRAERERLIYEEGRSESILAKFYHLMILTRRRHQIPPQPFIWFRNLIECMGNGLTIRVASKDGNPVASILTLSYKDSLVYKYGCSDESFHNLGGIHLLFWRAIREGKKLGVQEFDLGRSEPDNSGLVAFKDHWGSHCSTMSYYRYPKRPAASHAASWGLWLGKQACALLPDSVLTTTGKLLYRHIG